MARIDLSPWETMLAQGEFAVSFHRAFEPLRKVCPENLLLGIGLRPIYSATLKLQFERK